MEFIDDSENLDELIETEPAEPKAPVERTGPEGGIFLVVTNGSLRLKKYIYCESKVDSGDIVIFEDEYGRDWGISYYFTDADFKFDEGEMPAGNYIRKFTAEDFHQMEELRNLENKGLTICEERVKSHGLPMKLLACDYRFDRTKVTFHFSAENRVDFRILVRDLASIFKCRIELHQVGVRDETRICGGIGFCGRALCCMSHLNKFEPISIKMARTQNLPLTPTKISGVCGRLLCCLNYEHPTYEEFMEGLPNVEDKKIIDGKNATVIMVSPLRRLVVIEYDDGKRETISKEEYISGHKHRFEETEA